MGVARQGRRARRLPGFLLVACAAIVVFGSRLQHSAFQYDDLHAIVGNQQLQSLSHTGAFFTDPGTFSSLSFGGMFRPMVLTSYALTHAVAGQSPRAYRLGNIVLHAVAGLLVVALLQQLGASARVSGAGGLLFLLHPVNVEVATYVSARSESLCLVFMLLSLYLWLSRSARDRWRRVAGLLAFGAALLSKSVAIVLPLALLLHDGLRPGGLLRGGTGLGARWRSSRWRRVIVRRHMPYWLLAGLYLFYMGDKVTRAMGSEAVRDPGAQLWTQGKALVYYLRLLVVPRGLTVEHGFDVSASVLDGPVLLALLIPASVLVLAVRWAPARQFWLAWMPLVLLPTVLVPLNVLVNEHRLYPVTAASAVLLAPMLFRARLTPFFVVLLLCFATLAHERTSVWEDGLILWSDARRKAPAMPRPHLFVGDGLFAAGRFEDALVSYGVAESIRPEHLTPGDRLALHNNRGATLLALGRHAEASSSYEKALRIVPDYAPSVHSLAALRAMGMGARRDSVADDLARRGLAALEAGDLDRSEDLLRQSLDLQEHDATRLALGHVLEGNGRRTEAEGLYRVLLLSGPDSLVAADAQRRLRDMMYVSAGSD